MLTQSYWSAGENMGRIKVTITEGYLNAPGVLPFVKVKNLVSFSFQHAPQQILESSGIAWPNAGMWYQPSRPTYHPASPAKRDTPTEDVDLHAHSPRHRTDSMGGIDERLGYKMPMQSSMYGSTQMPANAQGTSISATQPDGRTPVWGSVMPMPDPFVESGRRFGRGHYGERSNESDLSMPDYSHSITPASSRNATDDFPTQIRSATTIQYRGAAFDDLIPIFSSRNDGMSGVVAPANTRVSSAANTPQIQSRPSAAAEARAASYTHERSRAISITTKDALPKARETSDISMKSQFSEQSSGLKDGAEMKQPHKPASEVKGRKEGRASELDVQNQVVKKASRSSIRTSGGGKENATTMVTTTIVLSDGKRKRASTGAGMRMTSKDEEALGSSPTRKVSKIQSVQGILESSASDSEQSDSANPRVPLMSLNNLH
ncbi:hypothetical protein MMC30_003053 [Trapelia coarctata]|nr:hypothetical protein [Trapelia coarctata]